MSDDGVYEVHGYNGYSLRTYSRVPDEHRGCCKTCAYLKGSVNWWCKNEEAAEYRGTTIPGIKDCQFWEEPPSIKEKPISYRPGIDPTKPVWTSRTKWWKVLWRWLFE